MYNGREGRKEIHSTKLLPPSPVVHFPCCRNRANHELGLILHEPEHMSLPNGIKQWAHTGDCPFREMKEDGSNCSLKSGCVDTGLKLSLLILKQPPRAAPGHQVQTFLQHLPILYKKNQPQTHPARGYREIFKSVTKSSWERTPCAVSSILST